MINEWTFLALLAFLVYYYIQFIELKGKELKKALTAGLFLAFFDLIVENLGGLLFLWETKHSIFFLGYVPIEIFFLAIFAGAVFYHLIPKKFDWKLATAASVGIGIIGMTMEQSLIAIKLVYYYPAWNSVLAFIGYFVTFALMFKIARKIRNSKMPALK